MTGNHVIGICSLEAGAWFHSQPVKTAERLFNTAAPPILL